MSPRGPRVRVSPRPEKGALSPTAVVGIPALDDTRIPAFSFEFADYDHNGAWSWATDEEMAEIFRFLCKIGKRTWAELRPRKGKPVHHIQPIDTVCEAAQARITALGHDERIDTLFRFAVTDRKRLWGWATEGVFYVLWWDRDHQVCPIDN